MLFFIIAHTEPILKKMNQLKLSDMYTCYLLKLYYKLYKNKLPPYLENLIFVYDGDSRHHLRNRCIHLPGITTETFRYVYMLPSEIILQAV